MNGDDWGSDHGLVISSHISSVGEPAFLSYLVGLFHSVYSCPLQVVIYWKEKKGEIDEYHDWSFRELWFCLLIEYDLLIKEENKILCLRFRKLREDGVDRNQTKAPLPSNNSVEYLVEIMVFNVGGGGKGCEGCEGDLYSSPHEGEISKYSFGMAWLEHRTKRLKRRSQARIHRARERCELDGGKEMNAPPEHLLILFPPFSTWDWFTTLFSWDRTIIMIKSIQYIAYRVMFWYRLMTVLLSLLSLVLHNCILRNSEGSIFPSHEVNLTSNLIPLVYQVQITRFLFLPKR